MKKDVKNVKKDVKNVNQRLSKMKGLATTFVNEVKKCAKQMITDIY